MAFQDALFDTGLDAMAAEIVSVSLHSADGGATGRDALTGGTYARQTPTWGDASSGPVSTTAPMSSDVPGGTPVSHVALWDSGPAGPRRRPLAAREQRTGD